MPIRRVNAASPVGVTARRASFIAWCRARAWGANFNPSVVSNAPARDRVNSAAPSDTSNPAMRADTVDWVMPILSAVR